MTSPEKRNQNTSDTSDSHRRIDLFMQDVQ